MSSKLESKFSLRDIFFVVSLFAVLFATVASLNPARSHWNGYRRHVWLIPLAIFLTAGAFGFCYSLGNFRRRIGVALALGFIAVVAASAWYITQLGGYRISLNGRVYLRNPRLWPFQRDTSYFLDTRGALIAMFVLALVVVASISTAQRFMQRRNVRRDTIGVGIGCIIAIAFYTILLRNGPESWGGFVVWLPNYLATGCVVFTVAAMLGRGFMLISRSIFPRRPKSGKDAGLNGTTMN